MPASTILPPSRPLTSLISSTAKYASVGIPASFCLASTMTMTGFGVCVVEQYEETTGSVPVSAHVHAPFPLQMYARIA